MLFGGPTSKTIMRIICTKNVSKQPSTGGMEYDAAVASYLRALPQVEIKCLDEYNGRKWFAPMHSSNLLAQIRGTGWEKFVLLAYFPQRYELLPILSNKTVERSRKLLMVHNTHLLSDKPPKAWIDAAWTRAFLRHFDHVITVSQSNKHMLVRRGVPKESISVVHPAPNPELPLPHHFHRQPGRQTGSSTVRLLYLGRFVPWKGLRYLLQALARLNTTAWHLRMVGSIYDATHRTYLERLTEKLGLIDRVEFVDRVFSGDDIASELREADCLVLASLQEGYPMVTLEAMAFGLPIIATNVDGIPEQITDGVHGLLVPPANSAKLKEALEQMIDDCQFRVRLGRQARQRFEIIANDWKQVGKEFYAVLSDLWHESVPMKRVA